MRPPDPAHDDPWHELLLSPTGVIRAVLAAPAPVGGTSPSGPRNDRLKKCRVGTRRQGPAPMGRSDSDPSPRRELDPLCDKRVQVNVSATFIFNQDCEAVPLALIFSTTGPGLSAVSDG